MAQNRVAAYSSLEHLAAIARVSREFRPVRILLRVQRCPCFEFHDDDATSICDLQVRPIVFFDFDYGAIRQFWIATLMTDVLPKVISEELVVLKAESHGSHDKSFHFIPLWLEATMSTVIILAALIEREK